MQLGLRWAPLLIAGAVAGCLEPNPNLPVTGGEDASSGEGTSSSPSTGTPGSTETPTTSTNPTASTSTTASDTDPDTTDTEDPTTDTTGPAGCGGGNVCVPAVPMDWAGPVIWTETPMSDEPPACTGAYGEPAFTAFDDLNAPPAECDCDCGSATGNVRCASITLEFYGTDSACGGAPDDDFSISTAGTCQSGPSEGTGTYWQVADPGVTGGSCDPNAAVNLQDPSWGSLITACGGAEPADGACDAGDACVPIPPEGFETRVCVWQDGDGSCPNAAFSERFVRYGGSEDGRNCDACTCSSPTGSCSGNVRLWSNSSCDDGGFGTGNLSIGGSCGVSSGSAFGADAGTLSVQDVSCSPGGGDPVGEATPSDPVTLCCMSVE